MRFIKLALISFVVLFLLITLMGSLLPSHVLVSRAIDIQATPQAVKSRAFQLSQWPQWIAPDSTVNDLVLDPSGRSLRAGRLQVTEQRVTDSTHISQWRFGSAEMTSTIKLIPHAPSGVVTVQWQMEQDVRWYPWEKFATLTTDQVVGGTMEKQLENLKKTVESQSR